MTESSTFTQRLELFPITTSVQGPPQANFLTIDHQNLADLAAQFGTPLYLYDRATLDYSVQQYRNALQTFYPGHSGITYAGKAYLSLAIAQWTQQQDLWLDCTGAGELAIAAAAGVQRQHILVHGVNKTSSDLQAAIAQAGTIVVDNLSELETLARLGVSNHQTLPNLWLRFRPGIAVETHVHTQTGQDDSKFGMSALELIQAVQFCLQHHLPLRGLHFHQGSHFHDPSPLSPAIQTALDLIVELRTNTGWVPQVICPGGGWGVPYHEHDLPHASIEAYVHLIGENLLHGCQERDLPLPHLQLEPGRSLVARAGVALYQVNSIKHTLHRRWLLLDGGLADNPRPALYNAQYAALPVLKPDRPTSGSAWLAGPYCESGDILISNLSMPDVQPGEWIAIPVSGAYHLSMGSNYNGARKPAVVWLESGQAHLIQQRETLADLFRRDLPLPANQP